MGLLADIMYQIQGQVCSEPTWWVAMCVNYSCRSICSSLLGATDEAGALFEL